MPFRRLILLAALLLGACGQQLPTYRYRMTVEVDTPEGLRTGSSVIEVRSSRASSYVIPNPGQLNVRVKGEAVAIDLPGRKTLFVLLAKDGFSPDVGAGQWAFQALHVPVQEYGRMLVDLRTRQATGTLPIAVCPQMIYFRDVSDPQSLENVTTSALPRVFGPGVLIRRISIKLTNDDVTHQLALLLPWIDHLERYRTVPDNPFTNKLSPSVANLRRK